MLHATAILHQDRDRAVDEPLDRCGPIHWEGSIPRARSKRAEGTPGDARSYRMLPARLHVCARVVV